MVRSAFAGRLLVSLLLAFGCAIAAASTATAAPSRHIHLNCAESSVCAEVGPYEEVFGSHYYVGHDEPSTLFYSNKPGSGNRMRYTLTLPKDPSPTNPNAPGKSYDFELGSTLWFGLSMCDTQSYPEQVHSCTPDSDSNIKTDLAKTPGSAFTELQFYSPGWVGWPTWAVAVGASTCDPTKWCAALNIDSLSEDPVNGTLQNPACAARTGIEYVNFAFVTKDGKAQAPANPLGSTLETFTPNHARDLFMNSGDRISVAMFDTREGLRVVLKDLTTGETGFMTASPRNGFAQIKFDPSGDSCKAIPYAFHPMYGTARKNVGTIWAADQYNVSFDQEIGHFQHCYGRPVPATPFGVTDNGTPISCPLGNREDNGEPAENPLDGGDDNFCFPESMSQLVRVQGCTDTNTGFDGVSYQPVWPDGNTALHPTPARFTSPLTGPDFSQQYESAALSVDLPRIEANTCNHFKGGPGCTRIPTTDDGTPALFYPYFSIAGGPTGCVWQLGGAIPGTTNDFGKNDGYGSLTPQRYLDFGAHGKMVNRFNIFRNVMGTNPCPA